MQGFPLAGCLTPVPLIQFFFSDSASNQSIILGDSGKNVNFLVSPRTAFNRPKETTDWRSLSHPLGPFSQVITLPNTAPRNIVALRLAQQSVLDRRHTFGSLLAFNDTVVRVG